METIFWCICLAVGIYALYKYSNSTAEDGGKSSMNFTNVSEHIDRLNELRENLRVVEELIADISVCSPKRHQKSVTVEWTSTSGKKNQYNIWVDGKCQNTKELLKYAYSERDRLRSEMQTETKKLSEQCKDTSAASVKGKRKYQTSKR